MSVPGDMKIRNWNVMGDLEGKKVHPVLYHKTTAQLRHRDTALRGFSHLGTLEGEMHSHELSDSTAKK